MWSEEDNGVIGSGMESVGEREVLGWRLREGGTERESQTYILRLDLVL